MVALLLFACGSGAVQEPAPRAGADTPEPAEHVAPTWPLPCSDLYDDRLVDVALDFVPVEWQAMQADCQAGVQQYRPATFSFEGESVPAHARLKGNWSWDCGKMQFVVAFDHAAPAGRFHGVRKLSLDAPWYDRTLLHERVAFDLLRRIGAPSSCVNNARLSVNGEIYGVYAQTERIDASYLARTFEEAGGNLYQGGVELETNEEEADISRLQALQASTTAAEIAALVDMDQALRVWAAEAMMPALDNYWAGVEINYYLYDHPSRGFLFLPYDLDITFGDSSWTDGTLLVPEAATADPITYEHTGWQKEALVKTVLADAEHCEAFVEALREVRAAWDPVAMAEQVGRWDAQIREAYAEDPRAHYRPALRAQGVTMLQAFFAERAAFVDGWLAQGGHCPARW